MSAPASQVLPADLNQFLMEAHLQPQVFDGIYQAGEADWGSERLRYQIATSENTRLGVSTALDIVKLSLFAIAAYQFVTWCVPNTRFAPLPMKRLLLAFAWPVAVGAVGAGVAIWADGVKDPVAQLDDRQVEQIIFRENARNGNCHVIDHLLLKGFRGRDIMGIRDEAHAFNRYGIFPKDQCAKAVVVMEALSILAGPKRSGLGTQPQEVTEAIARADILIPAHLQSSARSDP